MFDENGISGVPGNCLGGVDLMSIRIWMHAPRSKPNHDRLPGRRTRSKFQPKLPRRLCFPSTGNFGSPSFQLINVRERDLELEPELVTHGGVICNA